MAELRENLWHSGTINNFADVENRVGTGHFPSIAATPNATPISTPTSVERSVYSFNQWAFRLFGGKPLTTTELAKHCYCWVLQGEKIKSWHRANIARVALIWLPFGSAA
jgi:hypothetical protein